jgi:hypothetical protein
MAVQSHAELRWNVDLKGLRAFALAQRRRRYDRAAAAARVLADEATRWMRENRPWEDQTGRARESLQCQVIEEPTRITIRFSGGGAEAPYMLTLEFDHAGEFAIVGPSLEYWTPRFRQLLQRAMRGEI